MPQVLQQAAPLIDWHFWIGTAVGVTTGVVVPLATLLGSRRLARDEREREAVRYQIELARIAANETETPLARAIAQARLDDELRKRKPKQEPASEPEPPPADVKTAEVVRIVRKLDSLVPRNDAWAVADRRLRVFFLAALFATGFLFLVIGAIRAVLFSPPTGVYETAEPIYPVPALQAPAAQPQQQPGPVRNSNGPRK